MNEFWTGLGYIAAWITTGILTGLWATFLTVTLIELWDAFNGRQNAFAITGVATLLLWFPALTTWILMAYLYGRFA